MEKVLFEPLEIPVHQHADPCSCEPTIAYVRVSSVGDRETLLSPEIQLGFIERNAIAKNKRIVSVITDIGKTGQTFTKRSIDKVLEGIKRGPAKSVTVWKWSRWGRNVEYSLLYISKVAAAGGRVDSATEDMDPATAVGRFGRGMMMQVDEFLGDLIGESWQAAHAIRRGNGLPHNGRPRFGYSYFERLPIGEERDPDAHDGAATCDPCRRGLAHFVTHPEQGAKLKGMYERYCSAVASFRKLAKELNDDGYRTALDGPWTPQAVAMLMDTGFAAGYLRSRSAPMRSGIKAKAIPASNNLTSFDVWVEGSHSPLIGEELWQKYKARRIAQATLPPRSRTAAHTLSGLLVCHECAHRLATKYSGRQLTHQWHCPGRESQHPDLAVSISDRRAQEIIRQWAADKAKPSSTGEPQASMVRRAQAEAAVAERTRGQVKSEIDRWMTKLGGLVDMATDQVIDRDTFLSKQAEYEGSVAILRAELAELNAVPSVGGRPDYKVFESIGAAWDTLEAYELNGVLAAVVGMVVVSASRGAPRRADPAARVEVVGAWEMDSWDRWLSARRKRPFA